MKKLFITLGIIIFVVGIASAQKFAYVDTEYILKKVPSYKTAQDQLEKLSTQYQKEVEAAYQKVDDLFKKYQSEKVLLSESMRQTREKEIIDREKEVKDLQQKYFGPEGTIAKKQEELLKPIQDQVFNAIKTLANDGGYATIFDVSNNPGIIYNNPKYDLSDKVVEKLGYKN
ncbi:MAG: OmpH family outer membrane protein [Prevotellaceae bacterium]|jgi:outer membrane protein|nr:OmpH family outer membrane protein [Prevotellaceae bacterium]